MTATKQKVVTPKTPKVPTVKKPRPESKVTRHAPATKPVQAPNLSERAMLVRLAVQRWTPIVTDIPVSRDVETRHNAQRKIGSYKKRLVDFRDVLGITTAINKIRSVHETYTLPWQDGGYRVLSNTGFFTYQEKMAAALAELPKAVDVLVDIYPTRKEEAKLRLGTMHHDSDYPTVDALRAMHSAKVSYWPLPVATDFRADLGGKEEAVRAQVRSEFDTAMADAMRDVFARLKDVIVKASERLKAYTVTAEGKVQHGFRDSLIGNIADLIDLIPSLNIMGDPALTDFATRIRAEITAFTPEQLRDSADLRSQVAAKADDIVSKMSAFM